MGKWEEMFTYLSIMSPSDEYKEDSVSSSMSEYHHEINDEKFARDLDSPRSYFTPYNR